MRKSFKIVGGLAIAGLTGAAGSAFTATGLTTTGTAASDQFIGGTISQAVTGATLDSIVYDYVDAATKTAVKKITLTFTTAADGVTVAAVATGGNNGTFSCSDIATLVSTCTYVVGADTEVGSTGITSLSVTVS
jgi:hypothetical protein